MESTIKKIAIEEVLKKLKVKEECQIIDVREEHEYCAFHIPSSRHVPLSGFDQKFKLIDKNRPAYIHCGVGKRAEKAAEFLLSHGFKNLFVIEGGIKAWVEAGYPVE